MSQSYRRTLLACGILLALLASCSRRPHSAVADSANEGKQRKAAPDFALKDADGKTVRLSDYRGKVVLLNFWATWCGPCRIEIPWFIEFERKHKDQGFAVIGVSMDDEGWEVVKSYVAAHKINYRTVLGNDEIAQLYGGVDSLPTTFIIDREGRVANVHIGLVSRRSYEKDVQELLGTPAGSSSGARDGAAARVASAR